MATRALFFNAEEVGGEPDRVYDAADWSAIFDRMVTDGYLPDVGDVLAVGPSDPAVMTVEVATGAAWVQGRFFEVYSAGETLTVPDADPANPRIDRIVVRLDLAGRTVTLAVKEGAAAASPEPPALDRDATTWELSLAQVAVAAGATSVAAGNITDERDDEELCGQANAALGNDAYVAKSGDTMTGTLVIGNDGAIEPRLGTNSRSNSDDQSAYPIGYTYMELGDGSGGFPGESRGLIHTWNRGDNPHTSQMYIARDTSTGNRLFIRRVASSTTWTAWTELT